MSLPVIADAKRFAMQNAILKIANGSARYREPTELHENFSLTVAE